MDQHDRHVAVDYARMIGAAAALLAAIMLAVFVLWMVTAEQKTKLYEADNMVCASQPFGLTCYERKPR